VGVLFTGGHRPRNQELEQLSSGTAPDDLSDFYTKLKKVKDHHHKYPDSAINSFTLELNALVEGGAPGTTESGAEADDREYRLY
jgi:splicing factor 3A subunit 3